MTFSVEYVWVICFPLLTQDVFDKCHVTKCNHRYCLACLQLILVTHDQQCAFDRTKITFEECKADLEMDSKIGEMELICADCKDVYPLKKKHFCHNQIVLIPPVKWTYWYKGLFCGDSIVSLRILGFLDANSVCNMSLLNKKWKKLANNVHLWRHLYKKKWGGGKPINNDWKALYINRSIDNTPDSVGIAIGDLFDNYEVNQKQIEIRSQMRRAQIQHDSDVKQDDIAFQLALELSLKEFNAPQPQEVQLLDGEVLVEVIQVEDEGFEGEEQVDEEQEDVSDDIHTSDFEGCSSVEVSPGVVVSNEFIAFGTNKKMYE